MDANTVFETERLLLRPFTMDDLEACYERTSDPEVMKFHNCGTLSFKDTRAGLEVTIRRNQELAPFGIRVIVVKATNQNVGFTNLAPCHNIPGSPVEISYDIVRKHWGNGYATEASARLLQHGFDDLQLAEVVAAINPLNVASARVVDKLGLSVREQLEWPKQGLIDFYAITKEAYENRSQG